MNFNQAFWITNNQAYQTTGRELRDVDYYILEGAWNGQNYENIYQNIRQKLTKYRIDTIQKDIAPDLFRRLTSVFNTDISKISFREFMETRTCDLPRMPIDVLSLNSPFYIERISSREIFSVDSLVKIKAPKKMGKTSFICRVINEVQKQNYLPVYVNFRTFERESFNDLDKFLRQLFTDISKELELEPQLDENYSPTYRCEQYFEKYLLQNKSKCLVLIFDEVEILFEYSKMIDFFTMLRHWKDLASFDDSGVWQRLYLILSYSREPYLKFDINQSPFGNVGHSILLTPFNFEQTKELGITRYQLRYLTNVQLQELQDLLGGHPYLIQLAFQHLFKTDEIFEKFLIKASTQEGIYQEYLRDLLEKVNQRTELVESVKQIIAVGEAQLKPGITHHLECIGLIKVNANKASFICKLYRLYFQDHIYLI